MKTFIWTITLAFIWLAADHIVLRQRVNNLTREQHREHVDHMVDHVHRRSYPQLCQGSKTHCTPEAIQQYRRQVRAWEQGVAEAVRQEAQ